jgi:hypothetical protein
MIYYYKNNLPINLDNVTSFDKRLHIEIRFYFLSNMSLFVDWNFDTEKERDNMYEALKRTGEDMAQFMPSQFKEFPQFEGTLEQLDNLTIKKDEH